MPSTARKLESRGTFQEVGEVVAADGARFEVQAGDALLYAKRAVSCLVAPEVGDAVLLSSEAGGPCYILAILERDEGRDASIALDGNLSIALPSGRFTVAAQEGVDLVSAQQVSIAAGRLELHAVDGDVTLERLTLLSTYVRAELDRVRLLSETLDAELERLSVRAKRSYRTVEELDQVKAEQIDYTAEKVMNLHGHSTLVTAEELVKVDAAQVHVG
jgi:Protein of unknown function (DUF3540)